MTPKYFTFIIFNIIILFVIVKSEIVRNQTKKFKKFGKFSDSLMKGTFENNCCPCNQSNTKSMTEPPKNRTTENENTIFYLPNSVWPLEYRLSMKFDFNQLKLLPDSRAYGNLSILVLIINKTDTISLHSSENLIIRQIRVIKANTTEPKLDITKRFNISQLNIVKIFLTTNITANEKYLIEINNFESHHFTNQDSGIITRKYINYNGTSEQLLATQFQPESARTVFPCFDEPRFKAKFILTLTTNKEYTMLSNMPEFFCYNNRFGNSTNWKTCTFEISPMMPVYNLAFAIVNFGFIEKFDQKGRRFRIWARKSQIDKAYFALDTTIEALNIFERKLKIDFPLKKIDSLAIPNLKGFLGMEHYGLITYEEPVIIWNEKFPLSFSKVLCASIICHEIAHQWFGNLVTIAWWKDLWLNEGFATFYSYIIAQEILNSEVFYALEHLSIFNYVRNFDDYFALIKSSIAAPIVTYVEAKFDYLSYKKGFIIVSMLEKLLGKQSFDLAITNYLNNSKFDSVSPSDLWESLNKYYPVPIENIIDGWLTQPCYPIVHVSIYKNKSINLKQNSSINFKNFKSKVKYDEEKVRIWNIPLYIIFGNQTFLSKTKFSNLEMHSDILQLNNFNISNDWLVLNLNYNSFFTTDYDNILFSRLSKQMLRNHLFIPPMSRAQIMQDFYDLSKKYQRNNLKSLLKLFLYLENETDPIPLYTAVSLLDKLNGLFEMRSFYPIWNKYLTKILKPSFQNLMIDFENNFNKKTSIYSSLRRVLLNFACKLKSHYCAEITNKIIDRWNSNKLLIGDYDLLHLALCKYIEMDTNGEKWQSIYNSTKFQSWDFINVKYYAMGCSKVPWIIEKNIDISYNVLKNFSQRIYFPHVSDIIIDNIPPDYLRGTTPLSNLLILSSIYNTPNSVNFLIRFNKDGLNIIYNALQYPSHFPLPNSIVEYAIPTLSHYNFITQMFSQKYKPRNVVLKEAKSNIDWILNNYNLEKQIINLL